jgi:preprotein translocase subunit SecG
MTLFLQIALLVLGVFLTIAVLLQQGKSYGLSGTISGSSETYFGKDKARRKDKILSRATTIMGIIFVLLVLFTFATHHSGYYQTKIETSDFSNIANIGK